MDNYTNAQEEQCSICLDILKTRMTYKLNCNHVYHKDCLKEWFRGHDTCPICRRRIDQDERYVGDNVIDPERFEEIFSGLQGWIHLLGKGLESFMPDTMTGFSDVLAADEQINTLLRECAEDLRTPDGSSLGEVIASLGKIFKEPESH